MTLALQVDHRSSGVFRSPAALSRDRYSLVGKLRGGGRADVSVCLPSGVRRVEDLVVIKTLPASASADQRGTHSAEIEIAAGLRHDNLVRTLGTGLDTGRPFIVTEYLEGITLRRLLRWLNARNEHLNDAAVARVLLAIFTAVEYADRAPIGPAARALVHRPIAAEDVFVTYSGQVKLLGFKPPAPRPEAQGRPARAEHAAVDEVLSSQRSPELGAVLATIGSLVSAPSVMGLWPIVRTLQNWQKDGLRSDGRAELAAIMAGVFPEGRSTRRAQLEAACARVVRARETMTDDDATAIIVPANPPEMLAVEGMAESLLSGNHFVAPIGAHRGGLGVPFGPAAVAPSAVALSDAALSAVVPSNAAPSDAALSHRSPPPLPVPPPLPSLRSVPPRPAPPPLPVRNSWEVATFAPTAVTVLPAAAPALPVPPPEAVFPAGFPATMDALRPRRSPWLLPAGVVLLIAAAGAIGVQRYTTRATPGPAPVSRSSGAPAAVAGLPAAAPAPGEDRSAAQGSPASTAPAATFTAGSAAAPSFGASSPAAPPAPSSAGEASARLPSAGGVSNGPAPNGPAPNGPAPSSPAPSGAGHDGASLGGLASGRPSIDVGAGAAASGSPAAPVSPEGAPSMAAHRAASASPPAPSHSAQPVLLRPAAPPAASGSTSATEAARRPAVSDPFSLLRVVRPSVLPSIEPTREVLAARAAADRPEGPTAPASLGAAARGTAPAANPPGSLRPRAH